MKVTYNWLKDFVDIKTAARPLADKLTMAGLEVVSLEEKDGDFVFEIEVTSNRPDWLSVAGIAREIAAITGKKLKQLAVPGLKSSGTQEPKDSRTRELKIEIEDKKDCPLYTARIIEGVKVGPSPDWFRKRLELVGCRSVNNIVDITNYILFTYGEPLHAFDLDKLGQGTIIVRRGKKGEKLVTIDGEARELSPEILVIANDNGPVAAAGVMGGKDTEVNYSTQNILLEAALFNPALIRRSRQALKLQSESAYRFERGVDLEGVESSSSRAVGLIRELSSGRCVLAKSSPRPKRQAKSVVFDTENVERVLGSGISPARIKQILSALGFEVKIKTEVKAKKKAKAKNKFSVRVPSYRQDVLQGIDLIEELARIHGYENIPTDLPALKPDLTFCRMRDFVSSVKSMLLGLGLSEAITYSLIPRDLLNSFDLESGAGPVEIMNPLSREQEILRTNIFPSLCVSVAVNLNRKQEHVGLFEVAKRFTKGADSPKEELALSVAVCGAKRHLYEQGLVKEEAGFLSLKGVLEALFERLGIRDYSISVEGGAFAVYACNERLGFIARLPQAGLDRLGIKNKDVFVLEILLEKLFSLTRQERRLEPLPKYPGISRDISLLILESVPAQDILRAIRENSGPALRESRIVDYYKGKQIPPGMRAMTISCFYRLDERTLTEEEIGPAHKSVCELLTGRFGARIR